MLSDAWLIARKDLKLEIRSRVALNQVIPFAILVLVLIFRPTGLLGKPEIEKV